MSKTDKTRPGWVVEFFEGPLRHDHRHGACHVETFEQARAAGRGEMRHHRWHCPRESFVDEMCPALTGGRCAWNGDCRGHRRRVQDDTMPCAACDMRLDDATCEHRLERGWLATQKVYGAGGVPRWFRAHVYHEPMRRSARDVLRAAKAEYNAGCRPGDDTYPDLEDAWEPPVLPRHSASWYWW